METTDKPILANEFISALSVPNKGVFGYKGSDIAKETARLQLHTITDSQKFILNDDLVKQATEFSMTINLKNFYEMYEKAIPPFNNMWIEWDDYERAKFIREFKTSEEDRSKIEAIDDKPVGFRMGYHIEKLFEGTEKEGYLCTPTMKYEIDYEKELAKLSTKTNAKFYQPYCGFMLYRDQWTLKKQLVANKDIPADDRIYKAKDLKDGFLRNSMVLLGTEWSLDSLFDDYTGQKRMSFLSSYDKQNDDLWMPMMKKLVTDTKNRKWKKYFINKLSNRFQIAQSALFNCTLSDEEFKRGYEQSNEEMINRSLISMSGDARFLVTIISMLNYDFIVKTPTKPTQKISHLRYGRNTPKNEYKIVTIELPKPKGHKITKNDFTGHGTPKKEHMRRGHWRWQNNKRTWVNPCKVGNKKHGTIIHDYKLKGV